MSRKWFLVAAILCVLGSAGAGIAMVTSSFAAKKSGAPQTTTPKTVPPTASGPSMTEREAQMQAREDELGRQQAQLKDQQRQLSVDQGRQTGLDQAVALYSAMPPTKAATLMAGLDTATAVLILRRVDTDHAAQILAQLDATKGATLMAELAKPPQTGSGTTAP